MPQITDVVKNLLIINVIIFFGTMFLGAEIKDWLVAYFPASLHFKPVQVVTHMFNHGSPTHLFFNMFALFMFGPPLETMWGPKKFLFFYLTAGFGAIALHYGVDLFKYSQIIGQVDSGTYNEILNKGREIMYGGQQYTNEALASLNGILNRPVVGASGAIYGLLVGFGMLFPETKLGIIFLPIQFKAKYFIPGILALDFIGGFTGFSIFGQGIAHFAHIGGALTGFLLLTYWNKFGSRL